MAMEGLGSAASGEGNSFPARLGAIVLAHAALILPLLGRTTLYDIDEGRIAQVSREMALSKDFITPRLGELPFACYPPLPYWLMAASGSVFGWNEFAMRLPGALCGIALVAMTGLAVRRLGGERAGLLAAAVLATLPGFLGQESTCRADVTTMFLATAALDRFLVWAEAEEKDRRRRDLALVYLLASLGVLAKGPIALAVLGVGGLAWFAVRGRWGLLRRMGWSWGIPFSAAIVLPWYLFVYLSAGAGFLRENLLLENLEAFTRGYQQRRPWYFYLKVAAAALFPWFLALGFSWRVRGARGLGYALAWAAGVFLFLSISSAKRQSYLVYLDVPLAMAAGITLAALLEEVPSLLRKSLAGLGGLCAATAAGIAVVPSPTWTAERIQAILDLMPLLTLLLGAGGIALAGISWRGGALAGTASLAALMAGGFVLFRAAIAPRWDRPGLAVAAFCRRAAAAVPPGRRIGYLVTAQPDGAFHFYAGHPLQPRRGEPGYYLLSQDQMKQLEERGRKIRLLDSVQDERQRGLHLVEVLE